MWNVSDRRANPRLVARVRGTGGYADPGRSRRRRDQGRGARPRRRGALLRRHQGDARVARRASARRSSRSIATSAASPSTSGRPRAAGAVLRMAKGCDIVVHNFRQGAMKKFGLAYDDLCARASRHHPVRVLVVRRHRAARAHRRQRPRAAGPQRPHEHHGRGRPAAGALRHVDHRPARQPGARHRDDGGADAPRADGRGPGGRHVALAKLGASHELLLRRVLGARASSASPWAPPIT